MKDTSKSAKIGIMCLLSSADAMDEGEYTLYAYI